MSTVLDLPAYTILTPAGGGIEGEYDADGRRSSFVFSFSWEDGPAAMEVIAGTPEIVSGVAIRRVPLQNPYFTDQYAVSLRHLAKGAEGAISNARPYSRWFVEVRFERPRWGLEGDDAYTSFRFTGQPHTITIPNTFYTTVTTGEMVQQNVGRPVGGMGVEISRHWVADQTAAVGALVAAGMLGTVNDAPYTIRNCTFPTGTLMLPSASSDVRVPLEGDLSSTLSLVCSYRALPWNYVINSLGNPDELAPHAVGESDFTVLNTL